MHWKRRTIGKYSFWKNTVKTLLRSVIYIYIYLYVYIYFTCWSFVPYIGWLLSWKLQPSQAPCGSTCSSMGFGKDSPSDGRGAGVAAGGWGASSCWLLLYSSKACRTSSVLKEGYIQRQDLQWRTGNSKNKTSGFHFSKWLTPKIYNVYSYIINIIYLNMSPTFLHNSFASRNEYLKTWNIWNIFSVVHLSLCRGKPCMQNQHIYIYEMEKRYREQEPIYIYICVLIIETCCFVKIFGLYRLWGIASQFSSQCSISVCKRIPSIYMFHDRGWYIYTLFHCCVSQIHKHRQNQKTSTTTVWPESVSTAPSGGSYYPGWKIEWLGLHPLHPMRRKPMYRMSPKGIEVFTHKTRI